MPNLSLTVDNKKRFNAALKFVDDLINNNKKTPIYSPRYKDFACEELPTPDGDKVHLMIIPPGDSMFNHIKQSNALVYIGTPDDNEHPPNAIFVRQDIFSLKNCRTRIGELVSVAFSWMRDGEKGLKYSWTVGDISFKEFLRQHRLYDTFEKRNSITTVVVTDKLTTDYVKAGTIFIVSPEFVKWLDSELVDKVNEEKKAKKSPWSRLFTQRLSEISYNYQAN